jgi:hypothetical protein
METNGIRWDQRTTEIDTADGQDRKEQKLTAIERK